MLLIIIIVSLYSSPCGAIAVDMAPLQEHLSVDTFEWLNITKEYKEFNISQFEQLNRGMRLLTRKKADFYGIFYSRGRGHTTDSHLAARICYITAMTYEASYNKIQKYYHIRFLYYNNIQYEAGYLVHEIIHKYQMMLEIYQMVYKKFYLAWNKNYAPVSYMLYIYTNILEFGMMVAHLCNMLHELNDKYIGHEGGIFENVIYERTTRTRGKRTASTRNRNLTVTQEDGQPVPVESSEEETTTYADIQEKVEEEKKRRRKVQKKERKKAMESGVWVVTTNTRKPKKSLWPLEYGWSIEYW